MLSSGLALSRCIWKHLDVQVLAGCAEWLGGGGGAALGLRNPQRSLKATQERLENPPHNPQVKRQQLIASFFTGNLTVWQWESGRRVLRGPVIQGLCDATPNQRQQQQQWKKKTECWPSRRPDPIKLGESGGGGAWTGGVLTVPGAFLTRTCRRSPDLSGRGKKLH